MEITSSEILDDDDDIELVASCKSIHPCKPKISGSVSVLQIRCLLAWVALCPRVGKVQPSSLGKNDD